MATHPNALQAPAPASLETILSIALWVVFITTCVFYSVLAFDYFIAFATARDGLWLSLFATLVGDEHARGTGSVHVDQRAAYSAGLNFMLMHTTTGALAMALGPFQFVAACRRRFPRLHRNAGKVYLVAVVMSMIGGLAYLTTTPLAAIYSGPPFGIALIGLDLMVLFTAWLAYAAIRRREIERHRAWMAYNFGLVLATPGLRLLWILFGWLFPDLNQAETNLGIMTFLLPLCVTGMLLWVAAQQTLARPGGSADHGGAALWRSAAYALAAGGTVLVAVHYLAWFMWPGESWGEWVSAAQAARDTEVFARTWPLAVCYVIAVASAMFTGVRAAATAVTTGQETPAFLVAAAFAALTGGALASWSGPALLGGGILEFYWWGLAALWLLALARIRQAARSGASKVVRDWTMYAVALAFLPITVLPSIPLWDLLDAMDLTQAVITAVTVSFAGHYLVAHFLIHECIERRAHVARTG